jgi:hypothetical protein
MTRRLPYTIASVKLARKTIEAIGLHVVGIRPDGSLLVADKPIDVASLVPAEAQSSPPTKRLEDYFNGAESAAKGA